ncbi:MAG: glycosyltransferase [Candidatus Latescibacteria bacterium]|nr:glycosyltransferase [Candidatus Latescibacterota bacterium]
MKVLLIEPGGWGGICHYTYNLAQALCRTGMEVALVTDRDYELRDLPRSFRLIDTLQVREGYWRSIRAIAGVWQQMRPDLIHVQATLSARRDWAWFPACNLLDIPILVTAHNVLPHDREEREAFGMVFAHSVIYRAADAIIVHGEANRRDLLNRFSVPEDRVSVIPHGDYTFAGGCVGKAEARSRLGLGPEDRVVLCFGTIRPYKGIHHLIPAFGQVFRAIPQARLLIAGQPIGVDPQDIERTIDAAGVRDAVRLDARYIPFQDIPVYFSAADLVVLPYVSVYQSGALQLAYAHARPVVVTATGALPESVDEGVNGRVVLPGDPDGLARAMIDLLSLPVGTLSEMGRHSRRLAEQRHAWADVAQKTAEVYRKVCGRS